MTKTHHVIIPDAHSKPSTNPRRFVALGNFLLNFAKNNRDANIKIIEMGDFEDMPSLSHYDSGTLDFEGRRFVEDLETAKLHRDFVYGPINYWLDQQSKNRKKKPKVTHIALGGNHFEGRINKYVQKHPELAGFLDINKLMKYEDWNIQYVPFLVPTNEDGISYCHYFQTRGTGKPIGAGKYPAQVLAREKHCSNVVGHSHTFDRASFHSSDMSLFNLVAGCYLDPNETEKYAGQSNDAWWSGISILKDVQDGYPTGGEEYVPIKTILEQFL